MCYSSGDVWAVGMQLIYLWSLAFTMSNTAHELGHTFGAQHDGETWGNHHNDCHQDSGLMGYGNAATGWSECSRDYILAYFEEKNGLSCLGTSRGGFTAKLDRLNPNLDGGAPCWTISGFSEKPEYNGNWLASGIVNGRMSYTHSNGNNVIYSADYPNWVIGTSSDLASWESPTWCHEWDLASCSNGEWGTWYEVGGKTTWVWSAANMSHCVAESVYSGCSYHQCVQIDSLSDALNGNYDYKGCYNGEAYYCLYGDCDNHDILCYDGTRYILSEELCVTEGAAAKCTKNTNDIGSCSGMYAWQLFSSRLGYVTDWYAYADTSCVAAMEIEDTSCLEDNRYGEKLCVYNNATVWYEEQKAFGVADICKNNPTFFTHVVYSGSEVEKTYYLHYRKYWKFIDDDEMSSQWVISVDSTQKNYVAWCDEEDLMQCVEGKWTVEATGDDVVGFVVDASMVVSNTGCAGTDGAEEEEADEFNPNLIIVIAMVDAIVIISCGIILYFRQEQTP